MTKQQLIEKLKLQIQLIWVKILKVQILLAEKLLRKGKKKTYLDFALAIRTKESSNNYQIVNSLGYLGAYQFGMARLCDLGYTKRKEGTQGFSNNSFIWKEGYSKEMFLNNPNLQDKVFKQHIKNLVERITKYFSSYLNKTINGIKITLSGLVAGAHLGGIGGIRNFLQGRTRIDAYGTSVKSYIKKFSGYNLEF